MFIANLRGEKGWNTPEAFLSETNVPSLPSCFQKLGTELANRFPAHIRATPVRKLVLLLHRIGAGDDSTLPLGILQSSKAKNASSRVDEMITHGREG
jgi:hypothetical protein